ncbi:MAG: urea ABC transporter ATP-binding protein UrtD [Deltaproteobacteria bacterium]|nr:urea ABC transporter ATP-binding protein UrtD [Deltaproteobacteria bacterium]
MPEPFSIQTPLRTSALASRPAPQPHLYLDGVTVSFDGFKALNELSLVVDKGELRTIIGPNGAGKTTMLDVITGRSRPDEGQVLFNGGHDLTRMDEATIANLGIGRKFQKPTVFENLTVLDNLELALKTNRRIFSILFFKLEKENFDRIASTLDMIGLTTQAYDLAGTLSHGQKQWLEIGMLLIQDQELLLLDEPVAGMTDQETEETLLLILSIAKDRTVIVVEHDMEFVRSLGARVTVLHEGRVLAEGSMEAIQNNPRVIEVYLGR